MQYLKYLADGEMRWINLDHVARASRTFNADNGEVVLVLHFADGDRLTFHGTTVEEVATIDAMTRSLDDCSGQHRLAA